MNLQNIIRKTESVVAVVCSALLGRRRMWTKSRDSRLWPELGAVDNRKNKLGEMETYPGVLPDIIHALKEKGMGFDEVSLNNGDIRYLDNNIVVFRGDAAKLLNRAFHGFPSGMAGQKIRQCDLRLGSRSHASARFSLCCLNSINTLRNILKIVHKRSLPNDPKLSHGHWKVTPKCNRDNQISYHRPKLQGQWPLAPARC